MQWLMAHMWMALAATGVLASLLGWAVRGLGLRGKLRRAEGERNIAVGSLQEKETELEALYAAGRTPAATEGLSANDDQLRAELEERELKLQSLSDELARSKAELNELRDSGGSAGVVETVSAAAVGADVAKVASTVGDSGATESLDVEVDADEASLQWRNRYLESQVRSLQDKVQELSGAAVSPGAGEAVPVAAAAPISERADSDVDEAVSNEDNVTTAKLKWQNDYLRQRLQYMETYGTGAASTETAATVVDQVIEPKAQVGEQLAESEEPNERPSDEEVAKLRWRNRYLEGRLAYYEGDKAEGADESDDNSGIVGLAAGTAVAAATAMLGDAESDEASETTEDLQEVVADAAEAVDFDDIDLDSEPAEPEVASEQTEVVTEAPMSEEATDVEAEVEVGAKPLALDGPVGGEGDDLTAIGGIGPKIEEVLNELGIYHFDQVAAWSKDNIDWVDDYLAFKGRIEREQWVEQAAALSGDT